MGRMKNMMMDIEEVFFEDVQELIDQSEDFKECLSQAHKLIPCEIRSWYENGELETLITELAHENQVALIRDDTNTY